MDVAEQIKLVRENLALALGFLDAANQGIIGARFIPRDPGEESGAGGRRFDPTEPLHVRDPGSLVRCVNNQVRAAFALSAIQTNRVLESVSSDARMEDPEPDRQAARCIFHLLSLTVDADLLEPVWVCPPEYRRVFAVEEARFTLEAAALEGKEVCWDDFGGLSKYLDLLEYCGKLAVETRSMAAGPEPEPVTKTPVEKPVPTRPRAAKGPGTDSVAVFVETRCELGNGEMIIAKDLYTAYQEYCGEEGWKPEGQRSFGMRLTGLGFERRRRGKGKHWWMGLSPGRSLAGV